MLLLRRNLSHIYNTTVKPILEYASQVWSPYNEYLKLALERVQRDAVRWIYFLGKRESVTDCMERNHILPLSDRRETLDMSFLRKIECGLFDIGLNQYIQLTHMILGVRVQAGHTTLTPGNTVTITEYGKM